MKLKSYLWMAAGILSLPILSSCTPDRASGRDLFVAEGLQMQKQARDDKYKTQSPQNDADVQGQVSQGQVTAPQAQSWQEDSGTQSRQQEQQKQQQAGVAGQLQTTPDGQVSRYGEQSLPPLGEYKYANPANKDPGQTGSVPGQSNSSPGNASGGEPFGTMGRPLYLPDKK